MHIDRFAEKMKADTDKFVEAYKREHAQFPDQYPLDLDSYGEWVEMLDFVIYGDD